MKRLLPLVALAGLHTGCLDAALAYCTLGGTGPLKVLDAVDVTAIQPELRGPIGVQFLPYANDTDLHTLVITLPQDLYVGFRGTTRFGVQDVPDQPNVVFTTGVVDFEVLSQSASAPDVLGVTHLKYSIRFTGYGDDDNYTHFQGTCPIEGG